MVLLSYNQHILISMVVMDAWLDMDALNPNG